MRVAFIKRLFFLPSVARSSKELRPAAVTIPDRSIMTEEKKTLDLGDTKIAVSNGFELQVKPEGCNCMRKSQKPKIRLVEHGLPTALQTHEILVDDESQTILATQMEEGRLCKLTYDKDTGEISKDVTSTLMSLKQDAEGEPFIGMHGLQKSKMFPGRAWVTLQYINTVVLVNIETLQLEASVKCPSELPGGDTVGGPHCAYESNGKLFVCMKGGASCHAPVEGVSLRDQADEATAHAIFRVEIDPKTGSAANEGTSFPVPPTPVMCAIDGDGNCWVACDASGSVSMIPHDGKCAGCMTTVHLPFHYAATYHQTGPGICIGPDGNPWFCMLKGEGCIGTIDRKTLKATMFELHATSWNPRPRIIHLSWCKSDGLLYAISSDLLEKDAVNSLFRIKFDPTYQQIIAQHEMAFPTQGTGVHRIAHICETAEPSVLVSELAKSQILQIFKSTLPPMESFPTKTMTHTVRKVYDEQDLQECPIFQDGPCACAFDPDPYNVVNKKGKVYPSK